MLPAGCLVLLVCVALFSDAAANSQSCSAAGAESLLALEQLQQLQCLPDDFLVPEQQLLVMRQCWQSSWRPRPVETQSGPGQSRRGQGGSGERPARMVRLRHALSCWLDRMKVTDGSSAGSYPDRLVLLLQSWSRDASWRQQQQQHVQLCRVMMESDLTPPEQAVFLATCARGMTLLECERSAARRGAGAGAESLVNMGAAQCLDRVQPAAATAAAWTDCTRRQVIDLEGAVAVLDSLTEYRDYGQQLPEQERQLLSSTADKVLRAVECTMEATGESRRSTVNYDTVRQHVVSSRGPQHVKELRLAVLEQCRLMEVSTVSDLMQCWWQVAPVACVAHTAHRVASLHS